MTIQVIKINQGTKFGTLKKPMFSLFDVIIFLIYWENKTKYLGLDSRGWTPHMKGVGMLVVSLRGVTSESGLT